MGEIYYGIEVANVLVTSENCNNITGDRITGSVSYNPDTNTLTLDNATIDGGIWFGYGDSRLENITITLIGENFATTIWTTSGTKTINGTGSLTTRTLECYNEQNTIIEDCTIIVGSSGYKNFCGKEGKLTIKNANVSVQAGGFAIGWFDDIELIDCEIIEPTNAQIIDIEVEDTFGERYRGKFICNENGNIAKKIVIKKK